MKMVARLRKTRFKGQLKADWSAPSRQLPYNLQHHRR